MKNLLAFALMHLALTSYGQTSPLPLDSLTHQVTYQGVVQVPGASQAELYSRAREWFATSFGSAKAVLEMDDRIAGKLIGRANSTFYFNGNLPSAMWRRIKVEIKDGRYRYKLTGFNNSTTDDPEGLAHPVESWLVHNWATYSKDGKPKKITASVLDAVSSSADSEIASLQVAMTKPATKSDW